MLHSRGAVHILAAVLAVALLLGGGALAVAGTPPAAAASAVSSASHPSPSAAGGSPLAAFWHWLLGVTGMAPHGQDGRGARGHGAPVHVLGGGCPNPDGGPCT